jgi:hypothetical protein
MRSDVIQFSGVDGGTGRLFFEPVQHQDLLKAALRELPPGGPELQAIKRIGQRLPRPRLKPRYRYKSENLASVGWAAVVGSGVSPDALNALAPLLEHRRRQAGDRYREPLEYRNGETASDFLLRLGVPPDSEVSPKIVPYYLLLIGGPEAIPFEVQFDLDVHYAVGRLSFESQEEYQAYARHVVTSEETEAMSDPRAVVFSVRNPGDLCTHQSAELLAAPTIAELELRAGEGWAVESIDGDNEATKQNLLDHLGGPQTPTLLFTTGHGVRLPLGHPRQRSDQGALVCQEWSEFDSIDPLPETYVAAADIGSERELAGLISFHLACYGAGTPGWDEYGLEPESSPIAPAPFVARLPQRLLSQGALACIAHVGRQWSHSFAWEQALSDPMNYVDVLLTLMDGLPVGMAMEGTNHRWPALAGELLDHLAFASRMGITENTASSFSNLWTTYNDARGTIVIGDPAVRLNTTASQSKEP